MSKPKFGQMNEYNEDVEFALRESAEFIKPKLPENMGFVLLMFDFGSDGNMFYISDAQRDDVLKAMQEFIDKNKE